MREEITMIHSDWHIHSEYSYDASNPLSVIAENAKAQGLKSVGITDHANFNDDKFLGDLRASAAAVKEARKKYPYMILGVELTPIAKPQFDYIAKNGTRDGYVAPDVGFPFDIELAATKKELIALGVRYAIGASHWRVDRPVSSAESVDVGECIKEWYRQQMILACDERVTILGHPWWHGKCIWYEDFSVIPKSMNKDIAAALKENGKYVECNAQFFSNSNSTEKFRRQYAEFMRELFETGIPITYGSDAHNDYDDKRGNAEKYLSDAGFADGDFSEIAEKDLW